MENRTSRFNSGGSGGALWARLSYLIAGAFQRTENACHCEPEDALRDHYVALGVTPDADHEVIKAAFRALAKKYHPDTVAHAVAAEGRFREINEAHAVLSNPEARTEYDRWLLEQRGGGRSVRVLPVARCISLHGLSHADGNCRGALRSLKTKRVRSGISPWI